MTGVILFAVAAIVIGVTGIFVAGFAWDAWKAGGVQALLDILSGPAPAAAEPAEATVGWWLTGHEAAAQRRPAKPWEPVVPPPVTGLPPWDAAADSLNTGYTRWHAEHLRELLGRDAS